MKNIIISITNFQKLIDLEDHFIFGIGVDRWCHFIIPLALLILFFYLNRFRTGFFILVSMIFLKEIFDLSMIQLFEPIHIEQLHDSLWDIFAGLLGLTCGLLYTLRKRQHTST